MRHKFDPDKEMYIVLTKYNYRDWKFELENLCVRKIAKTEQEKYSWLVKIETESIDIQKMDNTIETVKGLQKPSNLGNGEIEKSCC
jgi:hypothetical protein